jgi:signal transduction histidine kinase
MIAIKIATKERLRSFTRDLYELMYRISEAENDKVKEFEYFKLYVTYRDSVQNLKVGSEIATQRLHFESSKKETEIQLLKKERELQSEGLAIKNTQLIFAVVLSGLAVSFLVMSVRSYKRIKLKNTELSEKNEEIQRHHLQIKEQRDELNVLNEELRSQQEEVLSQRDALADKNREIEKMSKKIDEANAQLEQLVAQRTEVLENQNTRLTSYAFLNAHKLRAPLARIMGLVSLLQMKADTKEKPVIINHLSSSSEELRDVVSSISKTIQDEFNPDSN